MEEFSFSVNDSLSYGTNEGGAHSKFWTAVLVQMNTEKKVSERLTQLGIQNYLPVQTEVHQWSDRRKKVNRIVIPMILFVYVDRKIERQLRVLPYIYKFVSYPGEKHAAVIPEEQINVLKFMLNQSDISVNLMNDSFEIGQKVQIIRGSLRGLTGSLCYLGKDKPVVAIRIDYLGYACVNVLKSDIQIVSE